MIRVWSLGIHRRPAPLRPARRAAWLPGLAGWLVAGAGAVNIVSALTPELPARARLVAHLLPSGLVLAADALTLTAGLALLVLGYHLRRGRRRALWLIVGVLAVAGALDVVKGLDFEEALATWALGALLVWGRHGFHVRHDSHALRSAIVRAGLIAGATAGLALVTVVAGSHWATPGLTSSRAVAETGALLTLTAGPMRFAGLFAWVPLGAGILAVTAIVFVAATLFRPLRAAVALPGAERARQLVRRHGRDTLSFFKLRRDVDRLFTGAGRAFLGYRVEAGVLLISGDPVGPRGALADLVRKTCAFAEARGLRIGAVGVSSEFAALAGQAGLRAFYLGDEAILDTEGFSLEGRAIRKVRQSRHRLVNAGYRVERRTLGMLEPDELAALEAIGADWRKGAPERGFSMAMDGLRGDHVADSTVLIARDAAGDPRGYLHLVPAYGRAAMSLSAMCHARGTPNGLTEFLIVRAAELLREEGVAELSLNFAAFARYLHAPANRRERWLGAVVRRLNPYFQIESLYRFNAKFVPRWEPRYLLHEGGAPGFIRTALATLWAEGHLPRPAALRPGSARPPRLRTAGSAGLGQAA